MSQQYGIKFPNAQTDSLHELLVSLPTFYSRSSDYGYKTNGFEAKNADAYLFIAPENRVGHRPHPDMEVVIEPYGLYINVFNYVEDIDHHVENRFGPAEYIL